MADKDKKKAPELAVFRPRHNFMNGSKDTGYKSIEAIDRNSPGLEPNFIKLTDEQVKAEIDKGKHGREVKRPVSAVLNHCDLVSASEATTKAVKSFMG